MSKARRTTITMAVTMEVPTGINLNVMLDFVRQGLGKYAQELKDNGDFVNNPLNSESIKVSLLRRVTEYR